MEKIIEYKEPDAFSIDLKKAINKFFEKNEVEKHGNIQLYIKTVILLSAFVFNYIGMLTSTTWTSIFIYFGLQGITNALIGFNVMHDGSHGSYSKEKKWNRRALLSLELLGGSTFMWIIKHIVLHHRFTNTVKDDDPHTGGVFYITPDDKHRWFHKFQAWYAVPLYGIEYFGWIFIFDIQKYFTKNINGEKFVMKKADKRLFWTGKILFVIYQIIIPIYVLGYAKALVGLGILLFICGVLISIVFQLAHVNTKSTFPSIEEAKNVTFDESQLIETCDFATNDSIVSIIISWLLGGLNFQTVHHLFPKISHVHYRKLSKILKGVCEKNHKTYNRVTFWEAIKNHFTYLNMKGKQLI